ncbi:hypothetical protein ACPC54_09850 [Kitasatospora sp. NPDC094028]
MTTATAAASAGTPDENSAGTPDTAGGDIDRLHAFDGLFLRAEHLNRIQDYTREFASAIGRSGGPGVVEGYQVAVDQGALKVGGGLAIDAAGRPLRSRHEVSLPLKDLRAGTDAFWWVEVSRADWDYGDTPVQGLLCEDPCAGATTNKEFTAEGVRISLTADRAVGLEEQFGVNRRNWLASRLFAAEQAGDTPWLADPSVLPTDWDPPVDLPRPPVRLAVLIPIGPDVSQWVVDVWTARREVGAPPPERWWQGRLGMRPWNAYTAQVLQFQAQSAQWRDPRASGAAAAERAADTALAEEIRRIVEMAQGARSRLALSMKDALERAARDSGDLRDATPPPVPPLAERGFADLPPAGYLSVRSDRRTLEDEVRRVLGDRLGLRFCDATRADIAEAVQQAQHRDRIVLDSAAEVQILVPVAPVTASAVGGGWTGGWVAFVRSRQVFCGSDGAAATPTAGTAAQTAAEPRTAEPRTAEPPTAEPGDGR